MHFAYTDSFCRPTLSLGLDAHPSQTCSARHASLSQSESVSIPSSRRVSSNGKPPSPPSPGVPPSSSEGDWGGWGGWGDDDPDIDWVDLSKVRRNGSREAARARRR